MNNNDEYVTKLEMFDWYRVKRIVLSVTPRNFADESRGSYLLVSFTQDSSLSYDELRKYDNSKFVPPFLPTPKNFTFVPPNANVTYSSSNWPCNPHDWFTTKYPGIPGWIHVACNDTKALEVRVLIEVEFRGNQANYSPVLKEYIEKRKAMITGNVLPPPSPLKGNDIKNILEEDEKIPSGNDLSGLDSLSKEELIKKIKEMSVRENP
jgi:hypothetical protein